MRFSQNYKLTLKYIFEKTTQDTALKLGSYVYLVSVHILRVFDFYLKLLFIFFEKTAKMAPPRVLKEGLKFKEIKFAKSKTPNCKIIPDVNKYQISCL